MTSRSRTSAISSSPTRTSYAAGSLRRRGRIWKTLTQTPANIVPFLKLSYRAGPDFEARGGARTPARPNNSPVPKGERAGRRGA